MSDADLQCLRRSLQRLDDRIRRWSPSRWAGSAPGRMPRADIAYELALNLAELGRRAGNGAPKIEVPRLGTYAIADQVAVLGCELTGAPGAATYAAAAEVAVSRASQAL